MFKDMFSPMLQEMLEGAFDDHLGFRNTSLEEKMDSIVAIATAIRAYPRGAPHPVLRASMV